MASPCSPQPEISVAKLYQNFLDQVKPLKHPQRKLKAAFLEHEVSPEDWPHVQKEALYGVMLFSAVHKPPTYLIQAEKTSKNLTSQFTPNDRQAPTAAGPILWFAAAERGRVVKLVILIIIDVKEDEEASILIELYENDPNFVLRPPRAGAAQRVCDARLRSSLSLTGDLTGKELRIPWTDFFDTVPAPLAMNGNDALIMGAQDLQTWEERIITAIQAGPRA
ncbi:hypothetical protein FB451DRAFT_1405562 [Mycena latifolia]|nr:hypothetical protein FB451DRAFT_1405562 [Mycena latifolia]